MKGKLLFLFALLLASCGDPNDDGARSASHAARHAEAPAPPPRSHPPPPPIPGIEGSSFKPIPPQQALEAAKRMGPGDCSDLDRMQGLPQAEAYGRDPYYDRIMVHIDAYVPCLLEATGSTSPTHVRPDYPGVRIRNVSDLAHVLLADGGRVHWYACVPADIVEKEKRHETAFDAWIEKPDSRRQWHECLMRKHGARQPAGRKST